MVLCKVCVMYSYTPRTSVDLLSVRTNELMHWKYRKGLRPLLSTLQNSQSIYSLDRWCWNMPFWLNDFLDKYAGFSSFNWRVDENLSLKKIKRFKKSGSKDCSQFPRWIIEMDIFDGILNSFNNGEGFRVEKYQIFHAFLDTGRTLTHTATGTCRASHILYLQLS